MAKKNKIRRHFLRVDDIQNVCSQVDLNAKPIFDFSKQENPKRKKRNKKQQQQQHHHANKMPKQTNVFSIISWTQITRFTVINIFVVWQETRERVDHPNRNDFTKANERMVTDKMCAPSFFFLLLGVSLSFFFHFALVFLRCAHLFSLPSLSAYDVLFFSFGILVVFCVVVVASSSIFFLYS